MTFSVSLLLPMAYSEWERDAHRRPREEGAPILKAAATSSRPSRWIPLAPAPGPRLGLEDLLELSPGGPLPSARPVGHYG